MSEQTITLPWGMVEGPHSPGRWAGVTADGRTLVVQRDRPDGEGSYRAVAVCLPIIPDVPDAWSIALAVAQTYMARLARRVRLDRDVDDVLAMMICAGQRVGDHPGDRRWLEGRLADGLAMPWTVERWRRARRGPVQVPPVLDRECAVTTFALAGLRSLDSKRPTEKWAAATPGTRHAGDSTAYGVALAPSGLVLVDLDVKHGIDGGSAWAAWLDQRGLTAPATLTVRTASGGVHLIYGAHRTVHVRSHDGVLPGVDIKAGYIDESGSRVGQGMAVGPGSRVRRGDSWGEYVVTCDMPPAPLPEALAEALAELTAKRPKRRGGTPTGPPAPAPMVDAAHLDRRRWDRLQRMEQAILECAPGTRHDTINGEVYGAILAGCPPELVSVIALEAIRQAGIVDHDHEVHTAIEDALATREEDDR